MIVSNYKKNQYQIYLTQLPKIAQTITDINVLYSPKDFYQTLIQTINDAKHRIYLVTLYLEHDMGGYKILETLYRVKYINPNLDLRVLVDWHRAQRNRIGSIESNTNVDWYQQMARIYSDVDVPVYGVPINTREALGVFHLKGFIIDDKIIYSGASLNDLYLHQQNKFRYDRYHVIQNQLLSDILVTYIKNILLTSPATHRLNDFYFLKNKKIKKNIRVFRYVLSKSNYYYENNIDNYNTLAITPIVGLGKKNLLNKTIHYLFCSTNQTLIICTPYFNLPSILLHDIIELLHLGKKIEIIVGDKTTNDFYLPENQPFTMVSAIPYFYEINLRCFLNRLQHYIDNGLLIVRIWKNEEHGYHVKGVWVDDEWQLLTGNNLNPRAWRLDLENALLIHDPNKDLYIQCEQELSCIRSNTYIIQHFTDLQNISDYPVKIRKFISRLHHMRIK